MRQLVHIASLLVLDSQLTDMKGLSSAIVTQFFICEFDLYIEHKFYFALIAHPFEVVAPTLFLCFGIFIS